MPGGPLRGTSGPARYVSWSSSTKRVTGRPPVSAPVRRLAIMRGEIGAADVHVPRDDDQLVERFRRGVRRDEVIGTLGHDRRSGGRAPGVERRGVGGRLRLVPDDRKRRAGRQSAAHRQRRRCRIERAHRRHRRRASRGEGGDQGGGPRRRRNQGPIPARCSRDARTRGGHLEIVAPRPSRHQPRLSRRQRAAAAGDRCQGLVAQAPTSDGVHTSRRRATASSRIRAARPSVAGWSTPSLAAIGTRLARVFASHE